MKLKLLLPVLLLCCSLCYAVEITAVGDKGYEIKGSNYSASISPDTGNLSALVFGGENFLVGSLDGGAPSYFFTESFVKADSVRREGDKIISVTNGAGTAEYTAEDTSFTISIRDAAEAEAKFYIILDKKLVHAPDTAQAPITEALNSGGESVVWVKKLAGMKSEGNASFWGPWMDGLQVVDLCIKKGETRSIVFTAAEPSDEQKRQAFAIGYPAIDAESEELVLSSPKDRQVFQRSSKYEGEFFVSGKINIPFDSVQYKISGMGLNGKKLSSGWKKLNANETTGCFNQRVKGYAGGWYTMKVRALKKGRTVAEKTVEHWGIGEVFVGAGQSNSTNYGQFPTKQTLDMTSTTDGVNWRIADDPMLGQHDNSSGGSYYPSLGDILYKEFQVPIAFASTGHGGVPIEAYLPGTDLYRWFMTRVGQLGKNGFRAVLWHQGESNALSPTDTSVRNMTAIIRNSCYDAGWEFPWFVAKVSYHSPKYPRWPLIRTAHQLLWNKGIALQGPDTDVLTGEMRDYDGDGIHLSPEGLKAHAELWAQKLIPYIHDCID